MNGIILAGPRVYYAMAQDGLLFRVDGRRCIRDSRRRIAPSSLQAIWSSVLVLTGTYRALFTRVIYTEWIFFALLALGIDRCCGAARLRAGVAHAAGSGRAAALHRRVGSRSSSTRSPPIRARAAIGLALVVLGPAGLLPLDATDSEPRT